MQRRQFLKTAGFGAAGVAAAPFVSTASANETYTWDMVNSWPKNFPALGTDADDFFARRVEQLSNGRMRIRVHGAGELVPALEVFDAVAAVTAEIGAFRILLLARQGRGLAVFHCCPFGMNTTEMNT